MGYTSKDYVIDSIKEYCDDNGIEFEDGYVGKFRTTKCIGVICDNPLNTLAELFAYIIDGDEELSATSVLQIMGKPQSDSFGIRNVLYFPKLKVE